MKKRINDSEIEKAKESGKILFILTTLMLLVVIGGLVFFVIYDKGLIKFNEKNNEKKEEEKSIFSSEKSELHVDDSRISNLFNTVKITSNKCDGYNLDDKVDVDKMSDSCKFEIASNIYREKLVKDDNNFYVDEEIVKNAYESLYGYNSYKVQDTIPLDSNFNLNYNNLNKKYYASVVPEDIDEDMSSYEKIVSVSKSGSYLYIVSVPVFYNAVEKVLCKDYDCSEVVENNAKENGDDYYNLYLDHNKKKLINYKYKFKMDNVGFYKYMGFEKTNE